MQVESIRCFRLLNRRAWPSLAPRHRRARPVTSCCATYWRTSIAGRSIPSTPRRSEILGLRVYPSVSALPGGHRFGHCHPSRRGYGGGRARAGGQGHSNVVLLAGGFAELDEAGAGIQQELSRSSGRPGSVFWGRTPPGHISTPHCFTSAFFPLGKIRRGSVSFIAQTGNFATHTMKHILTQSISGSAGCSASATRSTSTRAMRSRYWAKTPKPTPS